MAKLIIFLVVLVLNFISCSRNDKELVAELFHDKTELEKAKEIYNKNCSSCHGETGMGDGVASVAFNPRPRNFHLPTDKWKNGKTLDGVVKTLTEGIQPNMWAYSGNAEDIPLLAKYVIFLGSTTELLMKDLHEKYK